jgi:hypothetical protein
LIGLELGLRFYFIIGKGYITLSLSLSLSLFLTTLIITIHREEEDDESDGEPTEEEIAAVVALQEAAAAEPSETAIASLSSMGFSREQVVRALRSSGNDIEHAADHLLSGEEGQL